MAVHEGFEWDFSVFWCRDIPSWSLCLCLWFRWFNSTVCLKCMYLFVKDLFRCFW